MGRLMTIGAAIAIIAVGVAPAGAAQLIGSDLAGTMLNTDCGASGSCTETFLNTPSLGNATASGVITAWATRQVNGSASAQPFTLRVVRVANPTTRTFTGIATGTTTSVPPGTATTYFPARLPIAAGDQIGIDHPAVVHSCATGAAMQARFNPPLADGQTRGVTALAGGACEPQVQAVVEPDADGDGYGDETQDQCPAQPLAQASPCTPALPQAPPASPPADTVAPDARLATAGKASKLGDALRKGIRVVVTSNEAATVQAQAFEKAHSFVAAVPTGAIVVATKRAFVPAGGSRTLVLKLIRAARSALRKRTKATLTLVLSARDGAGNVTERQKTLRLRR